MGGEIGGGCGHDHDEGGHDHGHSHGDEGHKHDDKEKHDHGHDHEHEHEHKHDDEPKETRNINLDAAFLHALGDMFLSLGVCVAATVMYFKPEYHLADPICTYVFSIIVFFTVVPITKSCIGVLMESAPAEINVDDLISVIKKDT